MLLKVQLLMQPGGKGKKKRRTFSVPGIVPPDFPHELIKTSQHSGELIITAQMRKSSIWKAE